MDFLLSFIFVFLGTLALDFIWTKCVTAVAHETAFKAACWGAATTILAAIITISYVKNPWLLISAGLGAWVGIYLSKRFN